MGIFEEEFPFLMTNVNIICEPKPEIVFWLNGKVFSLYSKVRQITASENQTYFCCYRHTLLLVLVRQTDLAWPPSAAHYRALDRTNYSWQWAHHKTLPHIHTVDCMDEWLEIDLAHRQEITVISRAKSKLNQSAL